MPIRAEFDWRQTGPQVWRYAHETESGRLTLGAGGRRLTHGERTLVDSEKAEYPAMYRRFIELIANGVSDVDLSPLVHVADAFTAGARVVMSKHSRNERRAVSPHEKIGDLGDIPFMNHRPWLFRARPRARDFRRGCGSQGPAALRIVKRTAIRGRWSASGSTAISQVTTA